MRLIKPMVSALCAALTIISVQSAHAATGSAVAVPAGLPNPSGTVSGPVAVPAPPLDYAAGDVCPFSIHETFPVDREVAYTYTASDGRVVGQFFTGALVGRITRTDTGRTILVDLSGDGVSINDDAGGSTLYGVGPYQVGFHAGDSPSRNLARITGLSALHIAANGTKTLVYGQHVENLCLRLA